MSPYRPVSEPCRYKYVIHLFFIIHHLSSSPDHHSLSYLSTCQTILLKTLLSLLLPWKLPAGHEEREHQEVEDWQRWKEEEYAHQEVTVQRESEEQKEAEAQKAEAEAQKAEAEVQKAEAEWRECLA
jgi:hypothetical protein